MRRFRSTCALAFAMLLISYTFVEAAAFRWMLPKTVIDATIVYTLDGCDNGVAKIKITPTLTARAVPDPLVGQQKIDYATLEAFWADKSISIQTFAGSKILNSMGSSPTSQTGQIFGNILGGLVKIAAVALGAPAVPFDASKPPAPTCASDKDDKSGPGILKQIQDLKDGIKAAELRLSKGEADAEQKKDSAAIQAAQSLITTLQDKLTITVKTTVDPGVTAVVVDVDATNAALPNPTKDSKVDVSGLVASICPSQKQLGKANWFSNLDPIFTVNKEACKAVSFLKVNLYLDFPHAHSTLYDQPDRPGPYSQSEVIAGTHQYRDVAYIPVLVWRGDKPAADSHQANDDDPEAPLHPFQLVPTQVVPFGQFGVPQALPIIPGAFQTLTWQVTFLENGEMTSASFTSKSSGVNVTSFLGSAASAANAVATEQRSVSESQATTIQGQADLIYQTQRFHTCQTNPATCPSK